MNVAMTYACWESEGLYHARNITNARTAADILTIPAEAVLVDAKTGKEAVQAFKLMQAARPERKKNHA